MDFRKAVCGLCGGRLEFAAGQGGHLARCPHCAAEIVLEDSVGQIAQPPIVSPPVSPPKVKRFRFVRTMAMGTIYLIALPPLWQAMGPEAAVVFTFLFLVFTAPIWIAEAREHRNASAIMLLNLLTGWTGLGWLAALLWAVYRRKEEA